LDFIQSLKNVRSLKLGSLSIPTAKFFTDLKDVVLEMPNLRIMAFGRFESKMNMSPFVGIAEQILKSKELEGFDHSFWELFEKECKSLSSLKKVSPFAGFPEAWAKNSD